MTRSVAHVAAHPHAGKNARRKARCADRAGSAVEHRSVRSRRRRGSDAATGFAAGTNPFSVAIGDVNGDGRPDLAVANASSDNVSVLLNQTAPGATTPSFAPQATFATGDVPVSVALGDLNGDGRPDLAVANHDSDSVSVLLNQTAPGATAPSFAAQATFAAGDGPRLRGGRGRQRRRPARPGRRQPTTPTSVSVLLNQTAPGATVPSFAPQATFATGIGPCSVAVGDLNGDGRPDLAVANHDADSVSVLLNTTAPGPAHAQLRPPGHLRHRDRPPLRGGGGPQRRRPARPGRRQPELRQRLGAAEPDGAGRDRAPASPPRPPSPPGRSPSSVAVGDVNGDGRPDLAVANLNSDSVSVLLNQTPPGATTPSFAPQATFAAGTGPISVAVGDVNGDGRPDLAVANVDSDSVSVLLNQTAPGATAPSFAAQATFAAGDRPLLRGGGGRQRRRPARPGRRQLQRQHRLGAAEPDGAGRDHCPASPPRPPSPPGRPPSPWRWGTSTATAGPTWPSPTTAPTASRCC